LKKAAIPPWWQPAFSFSSLGFSPQKQTSLDLLYLVPITLFFLLFNLGHGALASWDEAIYASVAKGIHESGDWLTLRLNGVLWLEKPPLAIWVTALFYKLFGVNELSARLFSALCGSGCVFATYWIGRHLLDRWAGLLGALVLLSSSHFLVYSRFGMLDAPLLLFIILTLGFFWLGQNRNRYLIYSGIALGLAFLTKGFAAFLVFPVIWFYALLANKMEVLGRSSYWLGVMLAAAIALPWYLAQLILHHSAVTPNAFSWSFFVTPFQELDAPSGLWYFYVRVLVNKFHPWILVAIVTAPWTLFRAFKDREEETIFLAAWMFGIFILLTLFHLKRSWYAMPLYPALSLTVGYALSRIFRERSALFVRVMFLVVMALHVPYSHIFSQDYSRDIKALAADTRVRFAANETVILYNYHESPAVSFYMGHDTAYADNPEELSEAIRGGASHVLIRRSDSEAASVAATLSRSRLYPVAEAEGLRLFTKKP